MKHPVMMGIHGGFHDGNFTSNSGYNVSLHSPRKVDGHGRAPMNCGISIRKMVVFLHGIIQLLMKIQQQKIEVQQQNYWMFHNQHGN